MDVARRLGRTSWLGGTHHQHPRRQPAGAADYSTQNDRARVASHENLGWMRTTGAEAQQTQRQRITDRDAEVAAAGRECRAARISGELKTYVAYT